IRDGHVTGVQTCALPISSTVLTNVSQVDPMKVTFPITEREYLRYADRIREHQERGRAKDEPELQLILVDGDTYPHPGRFYVANQIGRASCRERVYVADVE